MARTALILGGTGQVGRAVARRLADAGWDVTVAGRHQPADLDARFARVDRAASGELEAAVGEGVDVLVDVVPMTEADARQVAALAGRVGSVIAISSASVYTDDDGRSLDEATDAESFPRLPVPIDERQRTVPPGDDTYSMRKVAVERTLLAADALRATIVRPCAIHGPHTRWSREWYLVKRVLDGRRAVVLGNRGASRFHTTSTANLAEVIRLAAQRPAARILNCGDPEPPTALEIARTVAATLGHEFAEVLIAPPDVGGVGDHPWNVPRPFVIDMVNAEIQLGYRPVTSYARAVRETCEWLVEATRGRSWEDVLPGSARHLGGQFDYEAEDRFLGSLGGARGPSR